MYKYQKAEKWGQNLFKIFAYIQISRTRKWTIDRPCH